MTHFHFAGAAGEVPVPGNDGYTRILLHMDGTNGGTSFPDVNASGIGAVWTRAGSCTTTTDTPKFGTACYQGAANSYITSNQATNIYHPGSQDYTIDFWLKGTTSGTYQYIWDFGGTPSSGGASSSWGLYYDNSNNLRLNMIYSGVLGSTAVAPASSTLDGNWHHIACVRTVNTLIVFIDGVSSGTVGFSNALAPGSYAFHIGGSPNVGTTGGYSGRIDEFRYSLGTARWTANFTPPTGPYI